MQATHRARGQPFFLVLDTACGARRGELLALCWTDIGPDYRSITISKSLEQTKAGLRLKETKGRNVRTIPLSGDAIEALKRVRTSQDEIRKMCGSNYHSELDLVFCHPDGNYIRPDTVTKAVRRIAKRAGFSRQIGSTTSEVCRCLHNRPGEILSY
jgi:integrase